MLNGLALRSKFFIKVYVGGLYLPQKEKAAAKILAADVPRRMVMHFLYERQQGPDVRRLERGARSRTPRAPRPTSRRRSPTLCAWMEPIHKGNELTLTYVPGEGTEVEVNGKTKGTLPGKATSDAILATWIGPNPGPGADFKKAVLGG